jgi:hypothetical protein
MYAGFGRREALQARGSTLTKSRCGRWRATRRCGFIGPPGSVLSPLKRTKVEDQTTRFWSFHDPRRTPTPRSLTDTPLIHSPRMFYSTRTPIRRCDHPRFYRGNHVYKLVDVRRFLLGPPTLVQKNSKIKIQRLCSLIVTACAVLSRASSGQRYHE